MIPSTNNLKEIEMITKPSLDYRMDEGEHMSGMVEGLEALKQAIFCILNTERYAYPIYSWDYGIELKDLYGMPKDYVMSELPRRITEALTQDDRIESVDGFEVKEKGKILEVTFMVHTIYGNISTEKRWDDV